MEHKACFFLVMVGSKYLTVGDEALTLRNYESARVLADALAKSGVGLVVQVVTKSTGEIVYSP